MQLDIRTLSILTAIITFGLAITLFCFWYGDRNRRSSLTFLIGMALLSAGFAGLATRHLLPPFVSVIVANNLIALGYLFLAGGAVMLVDRRFPVVACALAFGVHLLAFLHYTYIDPDVVMRIVTISTLVLLSGVYVAVMVVPATFRSRVPLPRRALAGFFLLNSVYMVVRIVLTLRIEDLKDFMTAGDVQSLAFLMIVCGLCSIAFCLLWTAFADTMAREIAMRRRLEEKIVEFEQLSSVIAHDLRSPAAAVVSTVRFLRERPGKATDPVCGQMLELAEEGAANLLDMLDSIMEHHAAGGARPIELVSLDQTAQAARDNIAGAIEASAASIAIEGPMPRVMANRADVIRILQNLLQNAVKYRHPDRTPVVRITAERRKGSVLLRVIDNGLGIPAAKRKAVFGMFARLESNGSKGFGIGLACCHRIAEALGGSIRIEDRQGDGATFVLTLPAAEGLSHETNRIVAHTVGPVLTPVAHEIAA